MVAVLLSPRLENTVDNFFNADTQANIVKCTRTNTAMTLIDPSCTAEAQRLTHTTISLEVIGDPGRV
jgi:hypothetical protein